MCVKICIGWFGSVRRLETKSIILGMSIFITLSVLSHR